jgi:hypothetical protein
VTKEYVVAKHESASILADEVAAEDEGLRQPIGARLHHVAQRYAPLAAIAEQPLEAVAILRRGDYQDVAYARHHQRAERIVDHRLVEDRQELLGDGLRHGIEARAGPGHTSIIGSAVGA